MTRSEPIKREIEIAPAAASFTLSIINNKANGNAYILQMVAGLITQSSVAINLLTFQVAQVLRKGSLHQLLTSVKYTHMTRLK